MRGTVPLANRNSVGDAASMGLQPPETAADWSTLAAVPASSTGSRCDAPWSAQMDAAGQDAGGFLLGPMRAWLAQQLSMTIEH